MPQRIVHIDIAKGIGILLVVLAHNGLQAYAPFLHQFIYAFHMPLFFFLSGMFFKPEVGFLELLKKRFNSLLLLEGRRPWRPRHYPRAANQAVSL